MFFSNLRENRSLVKILRGNSPLAGRLTLVLAFLRLYNMEYGKINQALSE